MKHFINKLHTSTIEDYMDAYIRNKTADCILYSEDGSQFKIQKELFGQTKFMRQILTSAKEQCCSIIEILCPCKKEDLQHLVHFLYSGEINCDKDYTIFDDLSQFFGFPEDMYLRCQETNFDETSDGSSLCEDSEACDEVLEYINNESFNDSRLFDDFSADTITDKAFENSSENIPFKEDKQINICLLYTSDAADE